MPKRLKQSDLIPFYYAYRLGYNSTTRRTEYAEIRKGYGQFVRLVKTFDRSNSNLTYEKNDGTFFIEKTDDVKYIDEFTKIWLFKKPIDSSEMSDFTITTIPIERDGLLSFSVRSNTENNSSIWYTYNGSIYKTNVTYCDSNEENIKIVQIQNNMFFPIDKSTKVWYSEPSDIDCDLDLLNLYYTETENSFTKFYFIGV